MYRQILNLIELNLTTVLMFGFLFTFLIIIILSISLGNLKYKMKSSIGEMKSYKMGKKQKEIKDKPWIVVTLKNKGMKPITIIDAGVILPKNKKAKYQRLKLKENLKAITLPAIVRGNEDLTYEVKNLDFIQYLNGINYNKNITVRFFFKDDNGKYYISKMKIKSKVKQKSYEQKKIKETGIVINENQEVTV